MDNLQTVDKLYHFYREECIRLARSLVIKSSVNAQMMNKEVLQYGRLLTLDETDMTTWRYYKHLAGEYHEYDYQILKYRYNRTEDHPHIRVRSLDSQEMIDFTKENLDIHRATWRAYQIGSDYYNQLIVEYPELETLIKGIIYPIPKQESIEAEEHQIIFYDELLVDQNEYWLIEELNQEIKRYLDRWEVRLYRVTDDQYDVVRWGILYAYIPQMIMNIRLKYANTIFANKFHIWTYLASKGRLDVFKPYLTLEQSLWLYRNINWILANQGKSGTFDELMEYIMTKQRLPVSRFHAKHRIDNVLSEAPEDQRQTDYTMEFHRSQINLPEIDYETSEDIRTLRYLMEKEIPIARSNEETLELSHHEGLDHFQWSPRSDQQTKILESHVIDYSQEEVYPIIQTMFDYLVWSSAHNRYRVQITANNPRSLELMTMSQQEALVTLYYCLSKLYNKEGEEPDYIPSIYARDIYFPVLSIDLEEKILKKIDERTDLSIFIRYIKEIYPSFGLVQSTEEFYNTTRKIHEFKYKLRDLIGFVEDVHLQGELKMFVESLKVDYWVPLFDKGVTYHQFFRERGWAITRLTTEDYITLAKQILLKITGMELYQQTSVEAVQNAMVKLFERLSSYTIHFIKTINVQDVIPLDPPTMRIGFVTKSSLGKYWFNHAYPTINNIRKKSKTIDSWKYPIFGEDTVNINKEYKYQNYFVELTLDASGKEIIRRQDTIHTPLISNIRITGNDDTTMERPRYWFYNGTLFSDKIDIPESRDITDGVSIVVRPIETTTVPKIEMVKTTTIGEDVNTLLTQADEKYPWRRQIKHVIERKHFEQHDDEFTIKDWGTRATRPATLERVQPTDLLEGVEGKKVLDLDEAKRQLEKLGGTLTTDIDRIYRENQEDAESSPQNP